MRDTRGPRVRLFDAVFAFLLRPRIRRVRRWSFLVTLPGGILLGPALGIELTLGHGLLAGLVVALLDLAVLLTVTLAGVRLLGRERRDVLLDFLMHPAARRAIQSEARMLWTLPRAFRRRGGRRRGEAEFAYHRGSADLGFAVALIPALLAEGAALHLLLSAAWLGPKLVLAAIQIYGLLMLVAWALGPRVHPHRCDCGTLELRAGPLYVARIPIGLIERVERRPGRVRRRGVLVCGDEATLAPAGRVDIRLELSAPVEVERPLGDPVAVRAISVAVDDPDRLRHELAERRRWGEAPHVDRARARRRLGWLGAADLLDAVTS